MSRKAKRIYKAGVVGVLVVGLVAAGVVVWQVYLRPATAGQAGGEGGGEKEAVDALICEQARELLGRLRLTDSALAGMGVGPSTSSGQAPSTGSGQAEEAFEAAAGWVEANLDTWSARRAAVRAARRAVHAAQGKLRGTAEDEQVLSTLPSLKAALATANASEAELVAGAIPAIEAKLTAGQRAAWATIRSAPKEAGPYALAPGLTAAQLQKVHMAKWKKARQQLIAKTASDRSAAAAAYSQAMADALTGTQKSALAVAAENTRANLSAVIAARQKVLPRPPADDPGVMVEEPLPEP